MNKFVGWGIAVLVVMAAVLGLFWLQGDKAKTRDVAIFFAGWIVGAVSMYIKAALVYKP